MRILILACCLTPACYGLRSEAFHPHRPSSPRSALGAKPLGRHIQWVSKGVDAGIHDRIGVIQAFLRISFHHNATLHMTGGEMGARNFLAGAHSREISPNWSRYVNPVGRCGQSPFHEVGNFEGCKVVSSAAGVDISRLFDDGSHCINIDIRNQADIYRLTNSIPRTWFGCALTPSSDVQAAVAGVLVRWHLPEHRFGVYHIRRCDRGQTACTRPEAVRKYVEAFPEVDDWVFFTYAEVGYTGVLRQALAPLAGSKRFIFEDDLFTEESLEAGDNYFAMMTIFGVMERAGMVLDAHPIICKGEKPGIKRHTKSRRTSDSALDTMEVLGHCGGL